MESTVIGVVSDLHLCAGLPREDFHSDQDLIGLVDYLASEAQGARAELVLNGDVVDFLKVDPARPMPSVAAVEKLSDVARAHRGVFDALGAFAARGNRIVVLPGNHDVELSVSAVQKELVRLVCKDNEGAKDHICFPTIVPSGGEVSRRGSPHAYELPGVHIEHGNQFDLTNAFDEKELKSPDDYERFGLPVGSHFVFEVFNDLVTEYPWLDKIRPQSTAILLLLLIDPRAALAKVKPALGLGTSLWDGLRLHAKRSLVGLAGKAGTRTADDGMHFFDFLAADVDELEAIAKRGGVTNAISDPQKVLGIEKRAAKILRKYLRHSTLHRPDPAALDPYGAKGIQIATEKDLDLVCFGHTHVATDATQSMRRRYMNTGTWIALKVLDESVLEPALREGAGDDDYWRLLNELAKPSAFKPEPRLTFVEIRYPAGELQASLRTWRNEKVSRLNA